MHELISGTGWEMCVSVLSEKSLQKMAIFENNFAMTVKPNSLASHIKRHFEMVEIVTEEILYSQY